MEKSTSEDILFWLNYHRLTFGILPTRLPSNITITTLKQLRTTRTKNRSSLSSLNRGSKSNFHRSPTKDRLKLGEWKKLAKTYCSLEPSLAEVLFLTFETLNNENTSNQLLATRHELSALLRGKHKEFMTSRSIHFGQFLLFLWTQIYFPRNQSNNLESSTTSTNKSSEEFHSRETSMRVRTPKAHKDLTRERFRDTQDLIFDIFKKYLDDILFLVSDIRGSVRADHIDRLKYFFSAGTFEEFQDTKSHNIRHPFSSFFPQFKSPPPTEISNTSYDLEEFKKQQIPISEVSKFIIDRFVVNKVKYPDHSNSIRAFESLVSSNQWSPPRNTFPSDSSIINFSRKSSNSEVIEYCKGHEDETIVYGNDQTFKSRENNMSASQKQSLNQNEDALKEEKIREILRVSECKNCSIYVLCPLKYFEVERCVNCTIVFAPISKITKIQNCRLTKFIGISRILSVYDSHNLKFFVCVNLPPFLYKNNSKIVLGPYNSFYPLLEHHTIQTGINPRLNHFQVPYILRFLDYSNMSGSSGLLKEKNSPKQIYSLISEKKFTQFIIPFFPSNSNSNIQKSQKREESLNSVNPCVIPKKYAQEIQKKMKSVANFFTYIQDKTQNDSKRKEKCIKFINDQFKHWLVQTDKIKKISELMNYKVDYKKEYYQESLESPDNFEEYEDGGEEEEVNQFGYNSTSHSVNIE